jgi:homopolymeric O-antigen transport system permease protein
MISPIMWDIDRLGAFSNYAYLNPFTAFIRLVKLPALGIMPTSLDFLVVGGIIVFVWFVGWAVFVNVKNKIALWV